MIRLQRVQYARLAALYQRSGAFSPLIQAVIADQQVGVVFVDSVEDPHAAAVVTRAGFTCVFGDDELRQIRFNDDFAAFLFEPDATTPTYLLWYAPSPWWINWFATHAEKAVRIRHRFRLVWDGSPPPWQSEMPGKLPAGVRLGPIESTNFAALAPSGLEIGNRFWGSEQDFLEQGLGVCLLDEMDHPLCICYSACIGGQFAEIDIWTHPAHRQQGLASMTARAFISACRQRGMVPTWDCFSTNTASFNLARRLGFAQAKAYPFYSFNIPLAR